MIQAQFQSEITRLRFNSWQVKMLDSMNYFALLTKGQLTKIIWSKHMNFIDKLTRMNPDSCQARIDALEPETDDRQDTINEHAAEIAVQIRSTLWVDDLINALEKADENLSNQIISAYQNNNSEKFLKHCMQAVELWIENESFTSATIEYDDQFKQSALEVTL